jgi:hypothetical protein
MKSPVLRRHKFWKVCYYDTKPRKPHFVYAELNVPAGYKLSLGKPSTQCFTAYKQKNGDTYAVLYAYKQK